MRRYTALVPRYLTHQWRRSLLTIFGLSLAVALMVSTGTISSSILHSQIQRARNAHGIYHASVENLTPQQANALLYHTKTQRVGLARRVGIQTFPGGVAIMAHTFDEPLLELEGIRLKEGRWPQAPGEIALEEWIIKELDLSDQVDLDLGSQTEYAIVGTLANMSRTQITGYARGLVFADGLTHLPVSALIEVRPHLPIRQSLAEIQRDLGLMDAQFQENVMLLMALDGDASLRYPYIVLGLIVLATTVATIFNIFHISVLERIRQFGLLRSLGATPRQMSRIVLGEALLLCLLAIPIGMGLGIAGTYALVYGAGVLYGTVSSIALTPWVFVISGLVSLVSILLAALRPARLAARTSPLTALGSESGVLREERVVPKAWHGRMGKILGLAGQMAYLNLLRQKKRFWTTVFSLSLGVTLFVVFSYFTQVADPSKVMEGQFPGEFVLGTRNINWGTGYSADDLKAISALRGVQMAWGSQERGVSLKIRADLLRPEFSEYLETTFRRSFTVDPTGLTTMSAAVYGYPDHILAKAEQLLVAGEIDLERLRTHPEILVVNTFVTGKGSVLVTDLQVGDEISLVVGAMDPNEITREENVFKVAGVLSGHPTARDLVGIGPGIVMHQDLFQTTTGSSLFRRIDVHLDPEADILGIETELRQISGTIVQGRLISYWEELQKLENEKRQFAILFLSLIGLIVLISLLSILNTISTNLLLRTREFGMMRAIGLSPRQMRRMIRWEGFYYGLLSAFIGGIAGGALAYVLFSIIRNQATYLAWQIPWAAILLAAGGSLMVSLLATLLPLQRLSQISVVQAIRTID